MNYATPGLHGFAGVRKWAAQTAMLMTALLLAACGGGAGTTDTVPDPLACDPGDPATFSECGTVIIGLTDADGDFLNYTVDMVQLTLETANGRVVETLPSNTRINFTDYVDLTEVMAVATVPPATYVSGTITLDYSDAEVFVSKAVNSQMSAIQADGYRWPVRPP